MEHRLATLYGQYIPILVTRIYEEQGDSGVCRRVTLRSCFCNRSDSQQGANRSTSDGDEFAQSNPAVPSEQFSGAGGCSVPNTNPYAGMNPLLCKGVAAPVDSGGQCSLAGLQVLKVVGTTCYYCQRLNPPINGIIVPLGQLPAATAKGYRCGVDEADPGCSAVCQGSAMNTAPPATTSNSPLPANKPIRRRGAPTVRGQVSLIAAQEFPVATNRATTPNARSRPALPATM